MDDSDFFDVLYAAWAKTSGAETMFWMPEEDLEYYAGGEMSWNIWAVNDKQEKVCVATFLEERDAEFITAIHGCFSDLVRRLHNAIDESDRLDKQMDESQSDIAELARETLSLSEELSQRDEQIDRLEAELISARERIGQLEREAHECDIYVSGLQDHGRLQGWGD